MTNLINNIFAVDAPLVMSKCYIHTRRSGQQVLFIDFGLLWKMSEEIWLPPGTWQLLFLTRDATDSDWEKVVERDSKYPEWWYKDYELKSPFCYNSTQSGHSLLRSKGLNPDKNYCLIEKIC